MEKFLAPEPITEGDLNEQWRRFKREFLLFLTAGGFEASQTGVVFASGGTARERFI